MDFNKPGPNKRVCAFFIDSIIAQLAGGVFSFLLARNLSWLVWSIAILIKDSINGQSVGKFLVGTRVTDEGNTPAGYSKTIARNFFMIIPIMPIVEYFVMLHDKQEGKRLGDKAAKTRVTDLKPQLKDKTFLWVSILLAVVFILLQFAAAYIIVKNNPDLLKNQPPLTGTLK